MTENIVLRLLPVTVMLVLAGACGSQETSNAHSTGAPTFVASPQGSQASVAPSVLPDPCSLLTKHDAEKLAGTMLEDAVPVAQTCSYTGPVSGPTAQVEVYVGDGAKKMLDIDRDLGHAFTAVPGIGAQAHLEDGAVFFLHKGVWVAIRLVRLDDPAIFRGPLEEAARIAAGRM